MAKRTRTRTKPKSRPPVEAADPVQDEVEDLAEELLALWRLLPSALATDSAGLLTGDRHASGGSKGSGAPANLEVIKAETRIAAGVGKIAAEAVPILNLDRGARSTHRVISALPDWHRSLRGRGQPLAKHIRSDLKSWVRTARLALGIRKWDRPLGSTCPDHRDSPAGLLEVGADAQLAASLITGPPPPPALVAGPFCEDYCSHVSCTAIIRSRTVCVAEPEEHTLSDGRIVVIRRLLDAKGKRTDWARISDEIVWLSMTGEPAFTWRESGGVQCPKCKRQWTTLGERRMLARELAAAGDKRPEAMVL